MYKRQVERVPSIAREALGIVKSVTPYILIGIAIGAAMHGYIPCLLYTSDAADERSSVDLGGRRIIKKKK